MCLWWVEGEGGGAVHEIRRITWAVLVTYRKVFCVMRRYDCSPAAVQAIPKSLCVAYSNICTLGIYTFIVQGMLGAYEYTRGPGIGLRRPLVFFYSDSLLDGALCLNETFVSCKRRPPTYARPTSDCVWLVNEQHS